MPSYHFFERMEREIDWQHEYEKLEDIVCNEEITSFTTLDNWMDSNIRLWDGAQNYSSFEELRDQIGFSVQETETLDYPYKEIIPSYKHSKMEDFFLYAETVLNVCYGIESKTGKNTALDKKLTEITKIIKYDVEKSGFELKGIKGKGFLILQKNPAASAVIEHIEPSLADAIVEYNHFTLKGNINRKRELLKNIADGLEPRRTELKGLNKTLENDFFELVNKCNIRHNNIDPTDASNYYSKFAALTKSKVEEAYDLIYEESLMCLMTLQQVERKKKIDAVKSLVAQH